MALDQEPSTVKCSSLIGSDGPHHQQVEELMGEPVQPQPVAVVREHPVVEHVHAGLAILEPSEGQVGGADGTTHARS